SYSVPSPLRPLPRSPLFPYTTLFRSARALTEGWAPFDVELTSIEVFPQTDVIYIEIGGGGSELYRLHSAMNSSALEYTEPYPYQDRKSTRLNSSHRTISYAVFCLKKK